MNKHFFLLFWLLFASLNLFAQQEVDTTAIAKKIQLNYGGALRFNYNYSSWKPLQRKRGGDFGFEVFRINVDAIHEQWEFHIDQRFYAADFGGAFLKYGWFQYNLNAKSHLKIGLIPAYFGVEQFNSHSWFFQLPFYLGFEDDHDMGVSYSFQDEEIQLDIGYYKNAETLSFSNNAPLSDSRYGYDFSGRNQEINQVNLRFNYSFGQAISQKIGTSLQFGGIWNIDTKTVGRQAALGLQYELDYQNLNVKAQYLNYNNQPQNAAGEARDVIEMTAYGFPYLTAAAATIYSIGIAYTVPVKWRPITALQLYNDYSYMAKNNAEWADTQMNVLGILVSADPVYLYIDFASGLHHPWLGSQWAEALTTGDSANDWEHRFNINFGYYF
ncbi:MAG: hypothetical protein AB8G22_23080 [Saprospiraceae bacterium]